MRSLVFVVGLSMVATFGIGEWAHAKNPGKGLGRALNAGGGAGNQSGLGRVRKGLGRSGGLSKVGKSLGRSANRGSRGLNSAKKSVKTPRLKKDPAAIDGPTQRRRGFEQQLANEQRKLNHQLSQAQHLRALAEKNGNPELLAQADRMEAKARQHYDARFQQINRYGGFEDPLATPLEGDVVGIAPETTIQNPSTPSSRGPGDRVARKPSWRERLRRWLPFGSND